MNKKLRKDEAVQKIEQVIETVKPAIPILKEGRVDDFLNEILPEIYLLEELKDDFILYDCMNLPEPRWEDAVTYAIIIAMDMGICEDDIFYDMDDLEDALRHAPKDGEAFAAYLSDGMELRELSWEMIIDCLRA